MANQVVIVFNTLTDMSRDDVFAGYKKVCLIPIGLFNDLAALEVKDKRSFKASTRGHRVRLIFSEQISKQHEDVFTRHGIQKWHYETPTERALYSCREKIADGWNVIRGLLPF
jgi:hypothetical protein